MTTPRDLLDPHSLLAGSDGLQKYKEVSTSSGSMLESSFSGGNLPANTPTSLLSLPNELLTFIAEHCTHKETLKSLQLVAKRFDPLCKAFIWQSVNIDGDPEYHDLQMTHLVANGLISLVQELSYSVPSVFSTLSAHHLSTFCALETLVLYPSVDLTEDEEGQFEESAQVWPKVTTDALGRLTSLRDLTLRHGTKLEDPTFSLARHLPRLHTFTSDEVLNDLSSLFEGGPTLRFLDVPLNEAGIAAASACVRTLQSLAVRSYCMDRPVMRRRVQKLGALFDSKNNGGHPRPLRFLAIDDLDLGPLEDGPAAERFDVPALLRAMQGVELTTLRVASIMRLDSTPLPQRDFQHGVSLPSLKKLEIHGTSFTNDYLTLDEVAVRQLTAFAKAFPELTKLSLAFWDLPVTPIELANLPSTDSRRSLPAYSTLLDFLRCTKVTEVQVDWRAPTSEYWGWSVRLHRVGDIFEDEAFDSEGMSQSA